MSSRKTPIKKIRADLAAITGWNYQAVKKGRDIMVYEVYKDSAGRVVTMTEASVKPFGESRKDLLNDLLQMARDVARYPLLLDRPENGDEP